MALGAPLGLVDTVTAGIVSAMDREVALPAAEGQTAHLVGAIQTDAAINPGNSGGALVNCQTQLIGVNTTIATVPNAAGQSGGGSVGLGFAIPVDIAMPIADELMATGTVTHYSVGLQVSALPAAIAQRLGLPGRLLVESVRAGAPAPTAGLRPNDLITQVNGEPRQARNRSPWPNSPPGQAAPSSWPTCATAPPRPSRSRPSRSSRRFALLRPEVDITAR